MGLIRSLLERRAIDAESPVFAALMAANTAAGVPVTESSALRSTAVFGCTRILAETIGALPLPVYERLEKGKTRAPDHPLYEVLHNVANTEMTAQVLRETLTAHAALWGNGYAEIEYDGAGRVIGLWPLLPDRTYPYRDPQTKELLYITRLTDGQEVKLPANKVFHLIGLGFDGMKGYSPISMARQAVGLSLATEEYGARFFGDGAHPGAVVEHPLKLSEQAHQNLQSSLTSAYSGLGKSHRLLLLEEGMKWQQIGIPPEDAQFLETRKFQVAEIARVFRVPLHMLAELDRATFSNIEHQSLEFLTYTLTPWLIRWEQAISMRLFTRNERRRFLAEFVVEGLLRGDIKTRYEAYAVARQNGWMNANEIREKENMNPFDGGDTYLANGNMVPVDQAGQQTQGQRSLAPVYRDAMGRILRRAQADIMREAEKRAKQDDWDGLLAWSERFCAEHQTFGERNLHPVFEADGRSNEARSVAKNHAEGLQNSLKTIVSEAKAGKHDPLLALERAFSAWNAMPEGIFEGVPT